MNNNWNQHMSSTIKIAIVLSEFNSDITNELLQGALDLLDENNIQRSQLNIVKVPGAIEIPLIAKKKAKLNKYDAIICLGAVIQGETDHHVYVNQQVSQGCQQVMLEYEVPVLFGILTTHNWQQAKARVSQSSHKGRETAAAALEMIHIIRAIPQG